MWLLPKPSRPPRAHKRAKMGMKEMGDQSGPECRVNSYALVSYLPDPLGKFLNELRQDLDPASHGMSHLTLLPPRPLACGADETWRALKDCLRDFEPFTVELGGVEFFKNTRVIYVAVQSGFHHLVKMHNSLNCGPATFVEPFEYHPHITLAQDLSGKEFDRALVLCTQRWNRFRNSRSHTIDRLTFVQNTLDDSWTDLASLHLASQVAG